MNKIKAMLIMVIPILLIGQINWTEHTLINNIKPVNSIFTIDINGDSAMDVLGAAASFVPDSANLYWFKNDGSFSPQFTMDTIDNTADIYYYDVYAIDLDGDNDIDVLSTAGYEDDIIWYENNGDGLPTFTRHMLDAGFDGAVSIKACDLDHDGDNDILGAAYDSGVLAWWENIGGSPPSFTKRIIDDTYSSAFAILPVYIDGDSAMDILSMSLDVGWVDWWRNDGGIPPSFIKQTIASDYYPSSLYGCDLDGDGGNDVLATSNNLSYWLNDGSDTPFKDQQIIDQGDNLRSVYACDLDHDGDNDVLVMVGTGSSGEVIWYENNGPPNFFKHSIGWLNGVSVVYANDLDGDGDIDVLAGSVYAPNKILWWESDLLDIDDVCPVSIDVPASLPEDTVLMPKATITNLGSRNETFITTCEIRPGTYSKTQSISNLAPGDSFQVTFFSNFTFESDTYTVKVFTRLTGDDNQANDTLVKIINTYDPGVMEGGTVPTSFSFGLKNNPVKGMALFNLALPQNGLVALRIYDASGRLVNKVSGHKSAGYYQIPWIAKVNGVYFYTFESSGHKESGKLVIVH